MNHQQILDLYQWAPDVCFRHPGLGEQSTAVVGSVHTREEGDLEVHACEVCVITMEDIRREEAARAGSRYEPGHLGEVLQQ